MKTTIEKTITLDDRHSAFVSVDIDIEEVWLKGDASVGEDGGLVAESYTYDSVTIDLFRDGEEMFNYVFDNPNGDPIAEGYAKAAVTWDDINKIYYG